MQTRSIAREMALLVLGQIPENKIQDLESLPLEGLLNKALNSLMEHCREGLDSSAGHLEKAHQHLLETGLQDLDKNSVERIRNHLTTGLNEAEHVLNAISASLEFPRLLVLSDQEAIRMSAMQRVSLVFEERINIDAGLDSVMEGWRLKRLPRIDRDILRLAFVDLNHLHTPAAVACNEAVELANRYSDDQGRRMINGVLRRLLNACNVSFPE
ncbi:transcription antitermination factor NusB [Prochlorococcus sp. MIT 1307]|uniref:transcription antitermination factor NusB n=1 Tax=Prochlorococcus sp. MIT 1307 TaxID=3096219 RepID=UPI002A761858|nr:transcription antitermination factor NusB [Prochlorococcus sp. MIT 1307]